MALSEAIVLIIVFALYGLTILAFTVGLRRLGISPRRAVFLGFALFGALAGLWAALAWPIDVIMLIDFPGVMLGDTIYQQSIKYLGDPHSSQAHYTIIWPLRVPQVHVLTSIMAWGLAGALVQLARNCWHRLACTVHTGCSKGELL